MDSAALKNIRFAAGFQPCDPRNRQQDYETSREGFEHLDIAPRMRSPD
jgi:hypothetical protein